AVALDCEMVGVAGGRSELARLGVVDALTGTTLLDVYVRPREAVWDWRTATSGISAAVLRQAQRRGRLLGGGWRAARAALFRLVDADTIVVGHDVRHDLRVLRISPRRIVDTSVLTQLACVYAGGRRRQWGLRTLAREFLGVQIQAGPAGHCCVEDALAARDVARYCVQDMARLDDWAQGVVEVWAETPVLTRLARLSLEE
ncbi:ribonuclease H-like protein, partial [Trichocladium antarcticum]